MPETQFDPIELLDTAHLSRLTKIAEQTLTNWRLNWDVERKGPPFIRPNGKHGNVYYRRSAVLAWLAEHESGTTAKKAPRKRQRRAS